MRPPTLHAASDRFEILLRRYHVLASEIPERFASWLAAASESRRVFSTLESVCVEMFPQIQGERWIVSVAVLALKHFVLRSKGVELSQCGQALRIVEGIIATTRFTDPPPPSSSTLLLQALSHNAVLQARVAELECKLARGSGAIGPPPPLPKCPEQAIAFLHERRAEAIDALSELKYNQKKRKIEMTHESPKQAEAKIHAGEELILPRRALSMAGYWNVDHNELLRITAALVDAVELRGGTVISRVQGKSVCFRASERDIVLAAVNDVMSQKN